MQRRFLVTVFLMMGVLSCAPARVNYLKGAVNHATHAEVEQQMGSPDEVRPLEAGGETWVYRQKSMPSPTYGPGTSAVPYCAEYRLTFDVEQVLRQWERHRC